MQNCRYIATKSVESSGKFRFFSPPHRTATQHLLFYTYIRYSTATFPFYSSPSSSIILPAGLQIVFGCELKLPLLLLGMGSFEGKLDLENGGWGSTKAEVEEHPAGAGASCRTAHSLSSSMVRKKSDPELVSRVRFRVLRDFLANLQEVILGTKLCVLFPAIPLAVLAQFYSFGRPWIFALSLLGLAPLAERVSFLTEQIANYTGPTVGGLLNATCGNATELIIALLALHQRKIHVVKYSLLGSILSNLLLVLGSSLFCGGLANIKKEQRFDRKQADVNAFLLLLGLLCLMLPLMFRYSFEAGDYAATSVLWLSRVSSIFMFVAYIAYLFFQLKTHRQFFEAPEEEGDKLSEDEAVIGFWSAFVWLIAMTITIALLSEYVVGTIEAASDSWGLSVSFISLILLPIVGNAAEHAGSIIFAFKNKLDISLGVALGSASQILMFVVPLCVLVGWIMGTRMDLDFSLLETGSLVISIILTAFTLQDGTSHYMKGVILCLSYCAIAACFFLHKLPVGQDPGSKPTGVKTA